MGMREGCFTIDITQAAVGAMFDRLRGSLGARRSTRSRLSRTSGSKIIDRYIGAEAQYDMCVFEAFAVAFVAFRGTPDKVSPIVKGIMNSIKVSTVPPRLRDRAYARSFTG